MRNVARDQAPRPAFAPEIWCGSVPQFDHTNLENVRRAFQTVTPCLLQQAWLNEEEAAFSPGSVRTSWRDNSLLVFAELADRDIFNDATKPNQRTWEMGDVFEMFLGSSEAGSYVELHVTPGNQTLQLRYGGTGSGKTGRLEDYVIPDEAFYSMTWIESKASQWSVFAEIPALTVCGSSEPIRDTQWRFSFSRYDYTRGAAEPCISSTSPHAKPDFHRQHEWGVMTFKMHL